MVFYSLFSISLAVGASAKIASLSSIESSNLFFVCGLYPAHGIFPTPRLRQTHPSRHLLVISSGLPESERLNVEDFLRRRSRQSLSRTWRRGTFVGLLLGNASAIGGDQLQQPLKKNASLKKKPVGYGVKRHSAHCSESERATDRNNADRIFALAKSLRLRRHRSPVSRRLALELFNESMRLRPEWKQTDSRFAVDSGIETVFSAFACDVDVLSSSNGNEKGVSTRAMTTETPLKEGRAHEAVIITTSEAVESLRETLASICYSARRVQERLGPAVAPQRGQRLPGPYYLRKSFDHTHIATVASLGPLRDGLDAAIRLFLLGLAIPLEDIRRSLGPRAVESARRLGILGECPVDPSLSVSLVQLFPLDAEALSSTLTAETPSDDNIGDDACVSSAPEVKKRAAEAGALLADHSRVGNGQVGKGIASPADMVFATDWPPPASTALTEEPVMYIGPDSIGLVQHAPRSVTPCSPRSDAGDVDEFKERDEGIDAAGRPRKTGRLETILDLCCGSGVQGIAAAVLRGGNARVTCVDINPRAVRFTRFNAALNGLDGTRFHAAVGDLYSAVESFGSHETRADISCEPLSAAEDFPPTGNNPVGAFRPTFVRRAGASGGDGAASDSASPNLVLNNEMRCGKDVAVEGTDSTKPRVADDASSFVFDLVLANPPFVPVPPKLGRARKRYDAFASGGPEGEEVVSGIFRGVIERLRPGGILAVVTELANPRNKYGAKLRRWIGEPPARSADAAAAGIANAAGAAATPRDGGIFRGENSHCSAVSAAAGGSSSGSEPLGVDVAGAAQGGWDAVLFHEQRPWTGAEYSANRAGSTSEAKGWERHLDLVGIEEMAPGFVFFRRRCTAEGPQSPDWSFRMEGVEKLWAPYNRAALESTQLALSHLMQEL